MPMPEIGVAFRDVDAIANAWFARARLHLLGLPETALADLSLEIVKLFEQAAEPGLEVIRARSELLARAGGESARKG